MKFPDVSLKGATVLLLVVGSGVVLLMLGHGTIPLENRDFFNIALGAWLSWTAMAVKRVLDGSDSSDAKTATIADQAKVIAAQAAAPPAAAEAPTSRFP